MARPEDALRERTQPGPLGDLQPGLSLGVTRGGVTLSGPLARAAAGGRGQAGLWQVLGEQWVSWGWAGTTEPVLPVLSASARWVRGLRPNPDVPADSFF